MAELSARDGDLDSAINLYLKARLLAPDRGLIYIRLGQLTLENGGSIEDARNIWQKGLENTVDEDAKKQLTKLINTHKP